MLQLVVTDVLLIECVIRVQLPNAPQKTTKTSPIRLPTNLQGCSSKSMQAGCSPGKHKLLETEHIHTFKDMTYHMYSCMRSGSAHDILSDPERIWGKQRWCALRTEFRNPSYNACLPCVRCVIDYATLSLHIIA